MVHTVVDMDAVSVYVSSRSLEEIWNRRGEQGVQEEKSREFHGTCVRSH